MKVDILGCVCFGWKSLLEMLFWNEAVWLVRKILFFGNWNPLTPKKCLWPRKSVYTSIFPSQHFRKMRERERARARGEASDGEIAPLIAISPSRERDGSRSRSTAREEDPRSWSRLSEIVISSSIAIAPSSLLMIFSWVVACVFLDLCFPSSFPNTRKYFLGNFLKCNQTHGNIFLFRKIAFPENMYFPENVLQQPFLSNSNFDNWVTFTKFVYNQLHFKGNLMSFSFSYKFSSKKYYMDHK